MLEAVERSQTAVEEEKGTQEDDDKEKHEAD